MNDNIIINAISKIYFTIVSFLLFIFLTLSIIFILLQNGVYIENISIPNVQIKKLYIKWNEKLNISVEETKITIIDDDSDSNISYEKINQIFQKISLFDNWFEKIIIKKITFNDIDANFKYAHGENGFLIASSPDFSLQSNLFFESKLFNIHIEKFEDKKRNISLDGNIIIDLYSKNLDIISSLNININDDIKLKIFTMADKEKLFYRIHSLEDIKNIEHTVKLFNLDKEIQFWAYDAIDMSYLSIEDIHGLVEYTKLDEIYKNINIKATVNDLKYTYNTKLDPIDSKYTELKFKNGVFYIYPREAYTYNFFLDQSWIQVDFTKKEELLTITLLLKAMLNNDILSILKQYKVDLPFYQHKGLVDTKLKLAINLRTIEVDVKGNFFTPKANFDYLGLNIDIFDANISLDNQDVIIKDMLSKYSDTVSATALVNATYDINSSTGKIDFNVKDISFKDVDLSLYKSKKPLHVTYKIAENKNTIHVPISFWNFASKIVKVDSLNMDLDTDKLTLSIPKTLVKLDGMLSGYVWGKTLIKPLKANLNIDLFKLSTDSLKLAQPKARLKLIYNEKFTLFSNTKVKFNLNGIECILANSKVDILNNTLDIKYSYLSIKDKVETKLYGKYNLKEDKGALNLNYLKIKTEELGEIFYNSKITKLTIDTQRNDLNVRSHEFDIDFTLSDSKWQLKLNDFSKLTNKSKLLKEYNLTKGAFTLYKKSTDSKMKFLSDITYPYEILVIDNTPVKNYTIRGTYKDDIALNINNSIDIKIDENINIDTDNIGINLNSIFDFFNDRNTSSKTKNKPNIIFNASNTYLYIDDTRHIISDTMSLQYYNNVTTGQLSYLDGTADIELINNNFHVYGENFNYKFMENLFALSKFKGGSLAFSMNGSTSEYDGVFYIKDTTIIDYKVLNNVLAFVNTIPSLITFSLPGYSTQGLYVSDGYMNFNSKDDEFDISDVYVKSKELTILGRGKASFKRNDIDLRLNLKTDLGSAISQIPIVGYILLGDDTIATTLSITGPLDNPKVESLIAEDIIVAPLNIIKRTFLLPYHLISGD